MKQYVGVSKCSSFYYHVSCTAHNFSIASKTHHATSLSVNQAVVIETRLAPCNSCRAFYYINTSHHFSCNDIGAEILSNICQRSPKIVGRNR